uniref:Uncharacterized protein n=1 Tax=Tanacetum cinerariifolium TaxID=118510 RepID=A0A6L2KY33_TANCI|nr:hypothetical protein [Tanacetum cinerariifolium]
MVSRSSNVVARHVIDEISKCCGETETPKYMKAFILQEITESRRLIRVLHDEVDIAKIALGQVNAMIAKMEAVEDPFEYADSLGCLKDSKRILGWKIMGLNQRIEDTEGRSEPLKVIWTSWMQQLTQRVAMDNFMFIISEIFYDKLFDPSFVNDLRYTCYGIPLQRTVVSLCFGFTVFTSPRCSKLAHVIDLSIDVLIGFNITFCGNVALFPLSSVDLRLIQNHCIRILPEKMVRECM